MHNILSALATLVELPFKAFEYLQEIRRRRSPGTVKITESKDSLIVSIVYTGPCAMAQVNRAWIECASVKRRILIPYDVLAYPKRLQEPFDSGTSLFVHLRFDAPYGEVLKGKVRVRVELATGEKLVSKFHEARTTQDNAPAR